MIDKEIGELRRRFRPDKSNVTRILGCYVNHSGEIISQFNQSVAMMQEDEAEKFLSIFKKTLTGTIGKQLTDITFTTDQVANGGEHKLLSRVRTSAIEDEEAVDELFQKIIQSVHFEDNYAILLAYDSYDVPYRGKDGGSMDDASGTMFTYLVCSVCPVKMSKPALSYQNEEKEFHNRKVDYTLSPPEVGFLFPAFDDRATNLYNALYYCKNLMDPQETFVDAIFKTEPPMAAGLQKEAFEDILQDALGDECQFEVLQSVHQQFSNMVLEHKANKEPTPLCLTKQEVAYVLENSGISEEHMTAFEEAYDQEFGEDTSLFPRNVIDTNKFAINTPDVSIKVSPERQDLLETRIIDGVPYILVKAAEGIEVNGVNVHISEKSEVIF
ncbi:MAG: DUF4317 domain-containing protein [Eubacteriales bacterium]